MQSEVKAKIEKYLVDKEGMVGDWLDGQLEKFERHPDIAAEFLYWMETKKYKNEVTAEGYTAEQIYALANFLDGIGVYNFLITLREKPEQAKQYIAEGFKIK